MPFTATNILFSMLAALTAVLTIRADARAERQWVYVLKPLTMLWVLALAWLPPNAGELAYRRGIAVGLLFSLVGDVLLMLPRDRFVAGLAAFLAAQTAYVWAFSQQVGIGPWYALLPFLVVLAIVTPTLWPHIGRLRGPVLLYEIVILSMAWRAWVRWGDVGDVPSLAAALGAVLFVTSDLLLGYNRFVRPINRAQVWILGTYFAAQWLIALSA